MTFDKKMIMYAGLVLAVLYGVASAFGCSPADVDHFIRCFDAGC